MTLNNLKEKILKEKNYNKSLEYFPHDTLYNYAYMCNKDHMDEIAINYLGNKITYKELFEKVDDAASALIHIGVKPGEYVCLSPLTTPEGLISFLAINKIGAVSHLINPMMSEKEIITHIKESNSKVYITMDLFYSKKMQDYFSKGGIKTTIISSLLDSFPFGLNSDAFKFSAATIIKNMSGAKKGDNDISWKKLLEIGKKFPNNYNHKYVENSDAAIAYTSGSTGESKGVVATNEGFISVPNLIAMSEDKIARQDGIYTSMPLWIFYSLANSIYEPLCLGVTLEMDPLIDPKKIDKRLKEYKFNHWNTVPFYAKEAFSSLDGKKVDLSRLKTISTGGDFLSKDVRNLIDETIKKNGGTARVKNGLGLNEVLGAFAYQYTDHINDKSAGLPLVGNKMKIVNPDSLEECKVGETGELYLASPSLMKGYFKKDNLTSDAIIYDEENTRWFKTGDLAHIDKTGEIIPDGRIKRVVMTLDEAGLPTKIFPEKIKLAIKEHKAIKDCEVITVNDDERITKPILFTILKDEYKNYPNINDELIYLCEKTLPKYMVPDKIIELDSFPLNPSLKVNMKELENIYYQNKDYAKKKIK